MVEISGEDDKTLKEEMNQRSLPDSFTIGSAVKEGAFKVYFNVDEEAEKDSKQTRIYKLLQLKKGLPL